MSAATEKQENVSRLFFETYLKAGFGLTEFQQAELERKAFGKRFKVTQKSVLKPLLTISLFLMLVGPCVHCFAF